MRTPSPGGLPAPTGWSGDRPAAQKVTLEQLVELIGSALAGWQRVDGFSVAGVSSGLFGMAVLWCGLFFATYVRWRVRPPLMKDRLATVAEKAGGIIATSRFCGNTAYVAIKGPVVAFGALHFFMRRTTFSGKCRPVGAAIVGTVEQVGIAAIITILGILTATYLADSRSLLS